MATNHTAPLATPLPWQSEDWRHIKQWVTSDRLPHAILIGGPAGIGKYHFAQAVATSLLCRQAKQAHNTACGHCRQCQLNLAQTHPDLHYVTPSDNSKQIRIDQVRAAIYSLQQTAQQGGLKIILIAPCEAINRNAADALLKSLEEPSANSLLLLVSDLPGQLPATLRSRCQRLHLTRPSHTQALTWLNAHFPSDSTLDQLLAVTADQPLTAQRLIEQGEAERYARLPQDLAALLAGNTHAITLTQQWLQGETKLDLKIVLRWLQKQLIATLKTHITTHMTTEASTLQALFKLTDQIVQQHQQLLAGMPLNETLLLESLLLDVRDSMRGCTHKVI